MRLHSVEKALVHEGEGARNVGRLPRLELRASYGGGQERADFSLSFERLSEEEQEDSDPVAADDTGAPVKEDPAACGCAAAPPTGLAVLGVLGLLAGRRRRFSQA